MEDKNNYALYIIAIIAIVAIVCMIMINKNENNQVIPGSSLVLTDATGQAYGCCCNPYISWPAGSCSAGYSIACCTNNGGVSK